MTEGRKMGNQQNGKSVKQVKAKSKLESGKWKVEK